MNGAFARSAALLGEAAMARLAAAHVAVIGVGGVGGWCAEALVRTGVGRLALVDDDLVVESNLNRQCPATVATLGRPKVEAMAQRLLAINPDAEIEPIAARYPLAAPRDLDFSRFSAVVDAIDSVDCKAELLLAATESGTPVVSSMGAALRTDPTRLRVTRFEKVCGDGLARALRQRFRRLGRFPGRFTAVWSDEPPLAAAERGSLMTVTAAFGMALASEVIRLVRE